MIARSTLTAFVWLVAIEISTTTVFADSSGGPPPSLTRTRLDGVRELHLFDFLVRNDEELKLLQGLPDLEALTLDGCKNISGAGIANIRDLPQLRSLAIRHAGEKKLQVSHAALAALKSMPKLETLVLQGVTLPAGGLASIAELTNLTHLRIEGRFEGTEVRHLATATKVTSLALRSEHLDDDGLSKLPIFPRLLHLDLGFSDVGDAGMVHIEKQRNLVSLDVHGTRITDEGVAYLTELKHLEQLNLRSTLVANTGCSELPKLRSLRSLNLDKTKITGAGLAAISQCAGLVSLSIADCQIADADLAALARLKKLKRLELDRTLVTDLGLIHIKRLTSLHSLNVRSLKITDGGLKHLYDLPNLNWISLFGTDVTSTGVLRLKGRLRTGAIVIPSAIEN